MYTKADCFLGFSKKAKLNREIKNNLLPWYKLKCKR